jgi:AcrR family transcriptional regulator
MKTKKLNRKKIEVQDRQERILTFARDLIAREGIGGLNMDRIADFLGYSKGTIYNHFACKEEILVALGTETTEQRRRFFERACRLEGSPREKMLAIGMAAELFAQLFPDHFRLEQSFRMPGIWGKVSQNRRGALERAELACMKTVASVVQAAIEKGDLTLESGTTAEDVVFGFWSLTSGAYSLADCNPNLTKLGIKDPFWAVRQLTRQLADGIGWLPISSQWDYELVSQRILSEIFSEESQAVSQLTAIQPEKSTT